MAITQSISALSDVPSISDPASFEVKAEAFLNTDLPQLRTEINTWAGQANTLAAAVSGDASTADAAASAASGSASSASSSATAAAASAAGALNAPGTSATSATSLALGLGSKSLTIQAGKAFCVGQAVVIARTSDPTASLMAGIVSAYNSATGALSVTTTVQSGAGTFTDWTVSLTSIAVIVAPRIVRVVTASGAVAVTTADDLVIVNKSAGAATTVNLPSSPATGLAFTIKDGKGDASSNNITITPASGTIDGASTLAMVGDYQAVTVVFTGAEWSAI